MGTPPLEDKTLTQKFHSLTGHSYIVYINMLMWPYIAISYIVYIYRYHGLAVRCVPWVDCDVERTVAPGLIEILPAVFSPMTYMGQILQDGKNACFMSFFLKNRASVRPDLTF